jgi:uncharacterized membrane protein YwaF
MTWGFLSTAHIVSLVLAVGIITALYFLLRKTKNAIKIAVLGILSFAGIGAIIFNLVTWNSPLEYLPLHLCSLNALVLPVAVFSRNKILNNLLLLWSLGALIALVLNNAVAEAEILSWTFAFYYFPHVLEFGIPVLMFLLKLVKKDVKCIGSTMVITVAVYTVIHFFNRWINAYAEANRIFDSAGNVIQVNYMFSITPENPLLDLFYKLIPHPYWYMYLSFAVVAVYLLAVYGVDIMRMIRKRKKVRD